ncbi:TRAP transporter substrate-binding protein [Sporosarcina highlanderae]|uniref:TRAP transporter substrate-binding protein n=1 Tax=Sporosarcina highlanderae TaxID=3035916 RepID=A0ABT8JW65_9BACL|nr:TRAP transporter substrate-binding protein [Sporosarcina highlanderae]MDN4609177.1 TRAP transporter substrate-binding protein [Sporosarcina highlanderae]
MFNKKFGSMLVLLVALLLLSACRGGEPSNNNASADSVGNIYKLKLGHNVTVNSEVDKGAKKFKELVEEKTGGKVTVEVFPSAQLGSEIDMVENTGLGAIDIVIPGDGAFGSYIPKYQGLVLPFLFDNIEHMDRVYKSEIGDEINQEFLNVANSRMLAVWHRGARNLTANKEITSPDDMKGMKLRVPTIPLVVKAWEGIGANPTPIDFGELFITLQQGGVDGQENPLDLIYTSNFHEVQSHLMLTEHTYSPWVFLINNDVYESFPEDIRKQFDEAVAEATEYQNQLVKDSQEDYKQKLQEKGMTIVEVDKSLFRDKYHASGVEEKLKSQWAPNLIERVRDLK